MTQRGLARPSNKQGDVYHRVTVDAFQHPGALQLQRGFGGPFAMPRSDRRLQDLGEAGCSWLARPSSRTNLLESGTTNANLA